MKSLSEIQPKIRFVKIKTRVNGTDDAKDVLTSHQRAFDYNSLPERQTSCQFLNVEKIAFRNATEDQLCKD